MPNTLAHIGIHGAITRNIIRNADLKWIYLGCIIPDVPWIFQRIIRTALPDISRLDLRLYAVVQASLFFCLILSVALAALSRSPKRTFCILALGSLLHLLLDATQYKWGNGVHLFAPFDWTLINYGFYWPNSIPTFVITLSGLGFYIIHWRRATETPPDIVCRPAGRFAVFPALLLVYLALPFFFTGGPEQTDSHYVQTLRQAGERPGKYVKFDRAYFEDGPDGGMLHVFSGERFHLEGADVAQSTKLSVKGRFITEDRIQVSDRHIHPSGIRDSLAYAGLLLVLAAWVAAWIRQWHSELRNSRSGDRSGGP